MDTGTGNRASPPWHTLYEAAVPEIDSHRLPQCIAEAERAIMDRMEDLNRCSGASENQALMNALNVLRDLRKMADESGSGR